jgi:thioredoxin reductase
MAIDTPARIAILGAGPIGLEAALYARYLGYDVDLYERGKACEALSRWGHVRMFTPFGQIGSPLGMAALKAQDPAWQPPDADTFLTGRELAERYYLPLAHSDLLADSLHEQVRVVAVGRDGLLPGELTGDEARRDHDFRLLLESTLADDHGRQRFATADAVIDATGTMTNSNYLGPGGLPAIGELAARAHFEFGLPEVLSPAREHFAGRNTLVVGDGCSAATNVIALAALASQVADTWVTWVTRQADTPPMTTRPGDPFAERVRIVEQANRLATDDANHVTHFGGTTVEAISWHPDLERFTVRLGGKHAGEAEFDRVIANVGYHADESISAALDVAKRPAAQFEAGLADYELPAATPAELLTGEPDYYVLGAKSYGRDSRFLIARGLQQIRALFTIIGDREGLDLYATMKGLY